MRTRIASAVAVGVTTAALFAAPAAAGTSPQGSVSHPLPLGIYHHLDKAWALKTVASSYNADAVIENANQFNDKPKHGYHYVTVTIRGAVLSGSNRNLDDDETFKLLGRHTHVLYSEAAEVAPHDLTEQNSANKGGHEQGEVVFEVKNSDINAKKMLLWQQSFVTFSEKTLYFKIK
jgi:hypothetical protein